MSVAKLQWNGKTIVDLTDKTVNASNLHEGYTAKDNSGDQIIGDATASHSVENQLVERTLSGTYTNTRITSLGNNFALARLTNLTEVNLPNVTNLHGYDFDASGIVTIHLPKITTISSYSFRKCNKLKTIDCPNVTLVKEGAFQDCTSLTAITSENFPAVTTIGTKGFQGCTNITEINLPNLTNLGEAGAVGSNAFYGCTKLTKVNLPNLINVGTGGHQFHSCTSLLSIHLTKVGTGTCMFQSCTSLLTAVIENGTVLNGQTFREDAKLITLDTNQTKTGIWEFRNCSALSNIILRHTAIMTLTYGITANNDSFYGTNFLSGGTGGSIYVPANLLENYKAATNWATLNSYGTVAWKTIEGSPYEHYWGDGVPMDGYQPINHMLTNSTFTGTGVTCVTNQANHVKVTLSDATAPVIINLTTKEIGGASVVNNLATSLFTIPASTQCKLWLTNIKNAAGSDFAINFRKTGQATSASFGTGNGTHTGDLTITQTLSSAEDVSCLFVYINTPVNGTIEFDVAFGVGNNRYI